MTELHAEPKREACLSCKQSGMFDCVAQLQLLLKEMPKTAYMCWPADKCTFAAQPFNKPSMPYVASLPQMGR